ncbi:MAG: tetratricopeptide repeat protein [Ignavibacteria bacterium]|nr:tetratricopeptide repeat protein [Ignavibacteria bacterium]
MRSIFRNYQYFLTIFILFVGCATDKTFVSNYSFYSNTYELYLNANKLDSSTIKFVKNKYLIDLIVNASKNEQLGLYHQAIVDLLDALRFDTSKVILFAIARNFYWIEKYTLAFDYGFRSYLLDTNFLPTIELLAWTLFQRYQYKEAYFFSSKLVHLKRKNLNQNDIKLHLDILDRVDTSFASSIAFLNSIEDPSLEDFVNSQLLYYFFLKKDTNNQNVILEKIFSKPDYFKNLDFIYFNIYFTNLLEKGEYEKAINKYEEFQRKITLDKNLQIIDIFTSKIKSIDSINKDLSKKLISVVTSISNDNLQVKSKLLQIYFILNDTTNSYLLCNNILGNEEIDLETLINTSYILYYDLKKRNEAIQKFQSFKFKFIDIPTYYNVLGEFYTNNQQYQLAEEMFNKSLMLDSNDYQIYINFGWLYSETENWSKSDSFYLKSLELFPENPIALNNFAYSLIQRDTNLVLAGKLIEKAIKIRPNDPNFLDTYGWYYFKLGNYEKAKEYIEKSIEIDNTRAEPFLHLSLIYKALGDEHNANYFFEKALSIDPNNKEVIKELEKKTK